MVLRQFVCDGQVLIPEFLPLPTILGNPKQFFNPAAWYDGKTVHLLYRAQSADNTSVFGYAASYDGLSLAERLPEPAYTPREAFEQN